MKPPYRDEIDFRELLRSPRRLFAYTFVYVLIVLVILGILYAQRMTDIGKASVVPLQLPDTTARVQDVALQAPRDIPPVDLAAVAQPAPALLERGRELYQANCASCHGMTGTGDGPSAATMNPKPRNFHVGSGWTNGTKISEIYRTLQEGIVRNGMASFDYIPPVDRFALVHYVRSFIPGPPQESLAELQVLETTYQLSRGTKLAGTVPLRVAEAKLLAETASRRAAADRLAERIRKGDPVVASAAADPARLATVVLVSDGRVLTMPPAEFARWAVSDPVSLGFRAGVARLGDAELSRLQRALAAAAGPRTE